jgi:hypothetical protein
VSSGLDIVSRLGMISYYLVFDPFTYELKQNNNIYKIY